MVRRLLLDFKMSANCLGGADMSFPADIREKLAELELELSEGNILISTFY